MNRETHGPRASKTTDTVRIASGLNALAGLWVFFSPWIFGFAADAGATWNSVIAGLIVAALALTSALTTQTNPHGHAAV